MNNRRIGKRGLNVRVDSKQERLTYARLTLVRFVENVRLRRALRDVCHTPRMRLWQVIYNALFDVVFLEWCKVFGSSKDNLHWSKFVQDEDQFREGLLRRLRIAERQWESYRKGMATDRNKSIAHHDVREENAKYQSFDYALEAAYFCYEIIVKELHKLGVDNFSVKNLREYSEEFAAECDAIAKRLNELHIAYESILQ
jgi:AbiU2